MNKLPNARPAKSNKLHRVRPNAFIVVSSSAEHGGPVPACATKSAAFGESKTSAILGYRPFWDKIAEMVSDGPDQAKEARPMRRPRDVSKRETREALIAAGIAAFREEGLDVPSLDSICARAGYTRGAFYVHFKDRDDFLIAVMSHVVEGFMDAIIATGDAALDLQKTIDTFVAAVVTKALPMHGGVPFHQVLAACARSTRLRERYVEVLRQAVERVANAASEGQGAGTVRTDVDSRHLAMILIGIVSGIQALIEIQYPLPFEAAAADLSKLLRPRKP